MTYRCLVAMCLVAALVLTGCGGDPSPTATPKPPPAPTAVPPTTAPPTDPPPTDPPPTATDAPPPTPVPTATVTATPTPVAAMAATKIPTPSNNCATFSGALEIQMLVGPADAVGLEPVAVGDVPIAALGDGDPCTVQGSGHVDYDNTLAAAWGTYQVTMNMDFVVTGTCSGPKGQETLDLTVEMSGNQNVSVKSQGFSGEYPWQGTHTRILSLPMEEGASASGEGWGMVLHVLN